MGFMPTAAPCWHWCKLQGGGGVILFISPRLIFLICKMGVLIGPMYLKRLLAYNHLMEEKLLAGLCEHTCSLFPDRALLRHSQTIEGLQTTISPLNSEGGFVSSLCRRGFLICYSFYICQWAYYFQEKAFFSFFIFCPSARPIKCRIKNKLRPWLV